LDELLNSRAKGNRLELKAVDLLASEGWSVYRVPPSRMFQLCQDIFNLWDILAMKEGKVRLIQVRSNRTKDISEHRKFAELNRHDNLSYEVWVWKDRLGWDDIRFL